MIKLIVAFGRNTFGLELVAVTNAEYVRLHKKTNETDVEKAMTDPDGISFIGTLEKAKAMCVGGTVAFA